MSRYLLLPILVAIGLNACLTKTQPPTKGPVDADLKSAFHFGKGSYWLFVDSLSGDMDSIVVTTDSTYYKIEHGVEVETMSMVFTEIQKEALYATKVSYWEYRLKGTDFAVFLFNNKLSTHSICFDPFVLYPFQIMPIAVAPVITGYEDSSEVSNIYDMLSVYSNDFKNVAVISHKSSIADNGILPFFSYNNTYFVAPKVGIVKCEYTNLKIPLRESGH